MVHTRRNKTLRQDTTRIDIKEIYNMSIKYLINDSTANVSLVGGAVLVPRGGYTAVPAARAEHEEVIAASLRGWISITDTQPGGISPAGTVSPIEAELAKDPFEGSTTYPGKGEDPEPVKVEDTADTQAAPASKTTRTAKK